MPTTLQFLSMKTMTNAACNQTINEYIYDETLCTASQVGWGGCFGDSGGPLTSGGRLIGLVSWGRECGDGLPNMFERISAVTDWIYSKTGIVAV